MQEIVVVGAGIIGLLTAYELLQAGKKVLICERREQAGQESSWAGGGILFPLAPWQEQALVMDLVAESEGYYENLAAQLLTHTAIDVQYRQSGMFAVLAKPARQLDKRWPVQPVQQFFVQQRLPQLSGKGHYLYYPAVAQIRNPKLLQALSLYLHQHDHCQFLFNHPLQALQRQRSGRLLATFADNSSVLAEKIVLTTGAWSDPLLAQLGLAALIRPIKGQMLALQAPVGCLKSIVVTPQCYFVPRADGLVLLGSSIEDVGFDKQPTAAIQQQLLQHGHSVMPASAQWPLRHHWAGLRPGAQQPYIGSIPGWPQLYAAVGHFRIGLTTAPATAVRLKNLILDGSSAADAYSWPSSHCVMERNSTACSKYQEL